MIGGCTSIQDRGGLVEIHSRMDTQVMSFSCPYSIYGVSIRRQQNPYYRIYALHGAGLRGSDCCGWRSSWIGGAFLLACEYYMEWHTPWVREQRVFALSVFQDREEQMKNTSTIIMVILVCVNFAQCFVMVSVHSIFAFIDHATTSSLSPGHPSPSSSHCPLRCSRRQSSLRRLWLL